MPIVNANDHLTDAFSVIFLGLLGLAVKYLGIHPKENGLFDKLAELCVPGGPYVRPYFGVEGLDATACSVVGLLTETMSPASLPFVSYFAGAAAPVYFLLVAVEGHRQNAPWLIALPYLYTLATQTAGFCLVAPLYAFIYVISGAPRRAASTVTKRQAEAILFSFFVGGYAPTIAMLLTQNPYAIVAWQFFPLIVTFLHYTYLLLAPKSTESGYSTLRSGYVLTFCISAAIHQFILVPRLLAEDPVAEFSKTFLPSVALLDSSHTLEQLVKDLLQWDVVLGNGAISLLTLWWAESSGEFVGLLLLQLIGSVFFGPGAAVAAALIWRETVIDETVKKVAIAPKKNQ